MFISLKSKIKEQDLKATIIWILSIIAVIAVFVVQWIQPLPKYGGDWHYLYPEYISEKFAIPQIWDHSENLGSNFASRVPLSILDLIQSSINHYTGLDFTYLEVIIWFIPFLFGAYYFSYKLSKKFFASKLAAVFTALFYTLNSYVLVLFGEAGHINILVAYALAPLTVLKLVDLLDKQNTKQMLLFVLSLSLVFMFDIRIGAAIGILLGIIIAVRLIGDKNNKHRLAIINQLILSVVSFFLINIYWIVPIILTPQSQLLGFGQNQSEWVKRLSFQEVGHGLFMEHPFWSNQGVNYFVASEVSPIFYILFLVIIIGIFLSKKIHQKRLIILLSLWLIGIFFLKGSNPPLGDTYIWLFDNVPGFNMFREPQKFYVLVALPFSLILGFSIASIDSSLKRTSLKYKSLARYLTVATVTSILIISIIPVFTTQFTGPLKARELPNYAQYVHDLVKDDSKFYRTLWIPRVTSSAFRSNLHPRIDANISFNEVLGYEEFDVYAVTQFVASNNFDYLMDKQSVRYIVFPNDPETLRWYESGIENISNALSQKKKKYKLIQDKNYLVFENLNYNELIYADTDLTVTNDGLGNYNVNFNSYSSNSEVAVLDQNDTLSSKIIGQSTYVVNISNHDQIASIENNTINSTEPLSHSELFKLNDKDINHYFNVSFRENKTNRYEVILTPTSESLRVGGEEFTLRNTSYSSTSGLLVKDNTNYLVSVAGQLKKFSSQEIRNGKTKGPFYIEDLSLKYVEIYQQNPELYLLEKFDDKNITLDVGDCNNYENTTLQQSGIGYGTSRDSKAGRSLILRANKHIACFTKALFTGAKDDIALLHLSYKHVSGSYPNICLFDNDKNECVLKKIFADASEESWTSKTLTYQVPKDTTRYNIYLYSDATEVPTVNLYDEVSSEGYFFLDRMPVNQGQIQEPSTTQVFMRATEQTIKYKSEIINQLTISNPSFENPINYQSQAKDCNNINQTELEDNKIKVEQVKDATHNRSALRISGARHSACYNIQLGELDPIYLYNIRFDSKSTNNSYTKYCILNSETGECELQDTIKPHLDWQPNSISFSPSKQANYQLYLSSYSILNDTQPYSSTFDHIQVFSYPINYESRFVMTSTDEVAQLEQPQITYEFKNPTTIIVKVKNATTPFYLFYGAKFDPAWKIKEYSDNGYLASYHVSEEIESTHFISSSYKNAWFIEKTGDFDLIITYPPQLTNIIGMTISLISTVLAMILIIIISLFQKLQLNKNES